MGDALNDGFQEGVLGACTSIGADCVPRIPRQGKRDEARGKWPLRLLRVLELLVKEHRRILVVPFPINKFNYLIRLRRRNFNRFLRFAPVHSCESKNGGLGRNDSNNGGSTPTIRFWFFVTDYLGKFEGQNTGDRSQTCEF